MISVIIPVYNMEKYLDDCLSSVLGQNYKNIEVLLVDDGSKDNSRTICEAWAKKDNRIRFFHKENGGQGSARNLALDNIKGDYISFIDSDDLITNDMYSNLKDAINENETDMAICKTYTFTDGETPVFKEEKCDIEYFNMTSFEAMEMRMNSNSMVSDSPCNKLYKAELFENLRFTEGRLLEDSALMYKLIAKCNRITHIKKVGYLIRNNMSSDSRVKYNVRRCDTMVTYEEMVDFISNNDDYKTLTVKTQQLANGAVFYNAGEFYLSKIKDKQTKILIKSHAKKQLKEYKEIKLKNKILLWLIANAFPMYGLFYKFSKRG